MNIANRGYNGALGGRTVNSDGKLCGDKNKINLSNLVQFHSIPRIVDHCIMFLFFLEKWKVKILKIFFTQPLSSFIVDLFRHHIEHPCNALNIRNINHYCPSRTMVGSMGNVANAGTGMPRVESNGQRTTQQEGDLPMPPLGCGPALLTNCSCLHSTYHYFIPQVPMYCVPTIGESTEKALDKYCW